ncbi:MAG: D-alanine--D-alanine ligase family protein, partial [Longimicrobiales bacterium]
PSATADERGVLEAVDAVELALGRLGHRSSRIAVDAPGGRWLHSLHGARADLVFNLCEGAGGSSANEARIAAAVELLDIPMTGSTAETLAFARRKDRVNAVLGAAGLPVPAWARIVDGLAPRGWTHFPAIVKPAAEDASLGITQASIARDARELGTAIEAAAPFAPLLVQQFLDGREINVGVLGDEVLPLSEIDFGTVPASHWRIVSYRAKWESGSDEDRATAPQCPALLDEHTAERARCLALDAWRLIEGRGYGRVDLRTDDTGTPHVLEVNPNPDLAPAAGFARMATAAGYDYVELIDRILTEALK